MRIVILGLTSIATFVFSSGALARKKSMDQYWAETKISRQILRADWLVDNFNCNQSEARFRGCVQAINAIALRANPPMEVVPESLLQPEKVSPELSTNLSIGPVRLQLDGQLLLVEKINPPFQGESVRVLQGLAVERIQTIRKALTDLHTTQNQGSTEPVDFAGNLEKVFTVAQLPAEIEPAAVARAIDQYMVEALDSHAHLNPMQQMVDDSANANQDFVGIGAQMRAIAGNFIVTSTIKGGTARLYGIKANDAIIAVDGESVLGLDLNAVVGKITGIENTTVVIRVRRKDQELDIPVLRQRILLENVNVKVEQLLGQKVLNVKIGNFKDTLACNKIEREILAAKAEHKDLAGVILDLRGNGGGRVGQALCIGGLFVGKQVLMKVRELNRTNRMQELKGSRPQITELPMVTLIDGASASASEVLAGALRDHKRSWVVGERSFGKATVQMSSRFDEGILIFRTIQRFYQPSGLTNQIVGIEPDFVTPARPDATEDDRFVLREGDIYPNALPAEGPTWQQNRPEEQSRIQACRSQGQAEAAFQHDELLDYQLHVAAEVLACR